MQHLSEFFRHLSSIVHAEFLLPPTHVTLYMLGTGKGIGLPSQEAFNLMVESAVQPGDVTPLHQPGHPTAGLNGGEDQGLA